MKKNMKLKVCGLNNPENILNISALMPDYVGFIFYKKSKRYISVVMDGKILAKIPESVKKVGVFVNSPIDEVIENYYRYKLDYVQLHGDEDHVYCARLYLRKIPVIKAFKLDTWFNFRQLEVFIPFCLFFLFDKAGDLPGGNGEKFSWEILKDYNYKLPFFLSGGIGPEDINQIMELHNEMLYAIDINSKFELKPGLKDVKKVNVFMNKLKLAQVNL